MTDKKKRGDDESPIKKHKEEDITNLRAVLLTLIASDTIKDRDKIEAGKLLARMHHALQVDKVTAKAVAKQAQAQEQNTLTENEQKTIEAILYGSKHTLPS